jgi:predicted ATPase/DNA-binding SARP family transcriptional activator
MDWIVPTLGCDGLCWLPWRSAQKASIQPASHCARRGIRTAEPLGPTVVIDRHEDLARKEASAMSTLEMHLLGEFHLVSADAPVSPIQAPRVQALLAYLVLHRAAPQPRQRLAFLLWPESTDAQARTNLRQLLHALRQTLPDADHFVHVTPQALQWRADAPCRLDVATFESALAQAQAAERKGDTRALRGALAQACAIYEGDLLPSCYDDWIVPERERLRQAYAGALERLALILEGQDEPRAALGYAQRLLRHDPIREETYRFLMRVHATCGDRAMVRRVYQTCVAVLERELGVEPSAATREEYEHSVRLDAPLRSLPASPPPTNTNLPVQLTSFVGRERELAELKPLLLANRLLTLTGPGGTGKTRLALRLTADVLETFASGVWLVELAPLADPTLVPQAVATTLGVREQPGRPILDALLDYLRPKTMLLLLDNCEHLIGLCAQLAETLLRAAPGVKILASSREAFGIAGEIAYRVPPLSLPDPKHLSNLDRMAHLDALAQNDSVQLFVERAATAFPPFRLTAKNAPAIGQICLRLDGIPLALELAAARTKVFPPEQIAARLDDRFRLLTGGSRTALPRHQTLLALIEWSHDLLSEAERVLLRRLSVFAGGWSLEAAQVVCRDGLTDGVLDTLARLADKSLIEVEVPSEAVEGRFRLLETIRQYAREKLLAAGEAEQVRDRHLAYFLHFAEEAEPKLRGAEQLTWLERVEREHDNLRTALGWALEGDQSDLALQLVGALGYFWQLRGYLSESQQWLEDALALAEREQNTKLAAGTGAPTSVEKAHRAKALCAVGTPHITTMNPKSAHTMAEEGLRLWRELGDTWWTAVALGQVGFVLEFEGDIQTALARLEEGVALAREIEDPWPLAVCLIRLGEALKATDVAAARPVLEEGAAMARATGDKSVLSDGLRESGPLYYAEGDLVTATRVIEEALAAARAIRNLYYAFLALTHMVIIACLQNDPTKAEGYCFELWALVRETGAEMAAWYALWFFGVVAIFGGEPQRGVQLIAATEGVFRQHGINLPEGDPTMMVFTDLCVEG